MMAAAERHGELVADFNPQPPWLRKAQMVGVGRMTSADEMAGTPQTANAIYPGGVLARLR